MKDGTRKLVASQAQNETNPGQEVVEYPKFSFLSSQSSLTKHSTVKYASADR
jgi:hypothetical protein